MSIITTLGKVKNDGTAPVYMVVYVNGERVQFHTKVFCEPGRFVVEKGAVKGSSKAAKDQNLIIENSRNRLNEIFVRYRLQNKALTPTLVKNEYKNPSLRVDFHAFMTEAIKERKGESAPRTIARDQVFNAE
ncbi:Arm DNA-binding domain-containing protein [Prolixibacter sp. SD074]|uniref:Arm DNA-binding domain-containing protein n=1 Tax=Prolixibacter sp. SD074 TaxID=2652391 RepID=UPI001274FD38|nr:Arm DNA-binding domain-containing protein [Prolixibacter sp. SD074]GET30520.1 hypothetical protein SD074_27220 [Prolixibacter sp. SD074]